MGLQADCIRIECRRIRHQHVITSPDVPSLYVASRDEATARRVLNTALEMLDRRSGRAATSPGLR